jgi:hypothetical protein
LVTQVIWRQLGRFVTSLAHEALLPWYRSS